jgi:hypothetical protein
MWNGYIDYLRFKYAGSQNSVKDCEKNLIRSEVFRKAIAKGLNQYPDIYHGRVLRAYIVGDDLWFDEKKKEKIFGYFFEELDKLTTNKKTKKIVDEYKKEIPEEAPLIHILHLLISGYPIDNVNYCKPSLAEVIRQEDEKYLVKYDRLIDRNSKIGITKSETELYPPVSGLINRIYVVSSNFMEGDYILAHRGSAVRKLDSKEVEDYKKCRNIVLEYMNNYGV